MDTLLIPFDLVCALALIGFGAGLVCGLCWIRRQPAWPRYDYDYGEMPVLTGESERFFSHEARARKVH